MLGLLPEIDDSGYLESRYCGCFDGWWWFMDGGGSIRETERTNAVLADSGDDLLFGAGISGAGGWTRVSGPSSLISHCSLVFSGFGVD